MLEAREEDYAAARRCFSRALDADSRNVAAVTAWTLMEERLGNIGDAQALFERALKQFTSPASDDNNTLWRAYELMEIRAGNLKGAQLVYHRYMRDAISPESFADTVSVRIIVNYSRRLLLALFCSRTHASLTTAPFNGLCFRRHMCFQ